MAQGFFLVGRTIQIRVGKSFSQKYFGTPQSSIMSHLLFSLMINGVFGDIENGMGIFPFLDDGAIWKRGRNLETAGGQYENRGVVVQVGCKDFS